MTYYLKVLALMMMLATAITSCGGRQGNPADAPESLEAKQLLQGVWVDDDTEDVVFKIQGDSVFYADSTSVPSYFKVVGDTLYIGSTARYHIEKHTEHVLWFRGQNDELMKLNKDDDLKDDFQREDTKVLTLTSVLKRDTVVFWNNERYHLYIAINPTKYKVTRHTLNEDGLDVENVYYDNIIHLSIFRGDRQLFSKDFRKQQYQKRVPEQLLAQSVLNDLQYDKTDAKGFHLNASICVPGDASCYLVENVISFDGKQTTNLLEY